MLSSVGKYDLQRPPLGQGTFASVYRGKHRDLNREAAIKILHMTLSLHEKQGFLREAQIIASLQHQHIVHILDFEILPNNIPCLIMEYAARGSLRNIYPRGTLLTPTNILPYLEQLAEALTYIHEQKVVHCDIKPENILLDAQNHLLLADFGIANLACQREQYIRGTPLYMAPEQIQGHPEPASDQYALAIVVYEWLCGQCPFTGQTSEEIRNKHLHMPPPPLRQFVPMLSPKVEQVVLQALAKEPYKRFQDVREFVTKFAEAAHTSSISANKTPFPKPTGLNPSQSSTIYSTLIAEGEHVIDSTLPALPRIDTIISTDLVSPDQPEHITMSTLPTMPGIDTIISTKPASPSRIKQGETLYELNFGQYNELRALAWSSDGQTLAAGCNNHQIFTWDALTGQSLRVYVLHETQIRSLAWSPNGRLLASACAHQSIHIWNSDQEQPQPMVTFRGHMNQTPKLGLACTLAWSPNGQLIGSGGTDYTARIWRAKDGTQLSQCVGHTNDINALCWSPDNSQVATASDDGSIRLWDIRTGQLCVIWKHHHRAVYALGWSHDGTLLASGGEGKTVYLWNPTEASQPLYKTYDKHARSIYTLSWSPNNLLLATAGRDSIVHIWDANSQTLRLPYQGHNNLRLGLSRSVLTLAWSPDGKYIASSDDDGIVQVWRAVD